MSLQRSTVLVFGTFDGIHEGHRFFLREAKKHGDTLIAVVAQDEIVEQLKNHPPKYSLAERMDALRKTGLADEILPGDATMGTWKSVERIKPNVLATGYDQQELRKHVEKYIAQKSLPTRLVIIPSHKPDTLHSSLLD